MTFNEIFVLVLFCSLLCHALWQCLFAKEAVDIWQPLLAIVLYFGFYCVLGPLVALWTDSTVYAGRDFRGLYLLCWTACLIAFACMRIGYSAVPGSIVAALSKTSIAKDDIDRFAVRRYALALFVIGFAGASIWASVSNAYLQLPLVGIEIGSRRDIYAEYDPSRVNYFYHLINTLTPALLITYLTNDRRHADYGMASIGIIVGMILVVALYSSVGFRYRLLILFVGMYVAFHLKNQKRPSTLAAVGLIAGFLGLMSVIAITRSYYSGLEFAALGGAGWEDMLEGAIRDSNTFFALGGVLEAVPDRIPFFYFEPLYYVFILPIPRAFWVDKPYPEYLGAIAPAIGTFEAETAGSAIPNFGEFYLAFGWLGLAIGAMLFGMLARITWCYLRPRLAESSTHRAIYCIMFPFIIYSMSRGYLAQIVQDFVFFLGPLLFVRKLAGSKVRSV
jgi:hypothetical protein